MGFSSEILKDMSIKEIAPQLGLRRYVEGLPVVTTQDDTINGLEISNNRGQIRIRYSQKVYLYRALGLLQEMNELNGTIRETASFKSNGIMLDCSRNAVPTVETIKSIIRQMALMGLNTLMLYMEDVYEVSDEPYFGYMRGRYTLRELQEIVAYAEWFGIETIPCIQTLAHLDTVLKWPRYEDLRDIDDILLTENERTYELIEKMLRSCRTAFKSSHIHIGMDEAHHIGRGRYYDLHGDKSGFELMLNHLKTVVELCRKYEFEAQFWSDMLFKICNDGLYYGEKSIPPHLANSLPDQIAAVYWDYYHDDYDGYVHMIREHQKLPCKTVFAGGAWKWSGYLPSTRRSMARSRAALQACLDQGVDTVFLTLWGDDGADASLFSVWPVVQLYAEQNFYREVDDKQLAARLKTCTGADLQDLLLLDVENERDGLRECGNNSPGKYLLFQDVLMGLFDAHVPENAAVLYERMWRQLKDATSKGGAYSYLLETGAALCGALALKADCGVRITEAYRAKDLAILTDFRDEILPEIINRVKAFRNCLEAQWMRENKVFGFEVQDIRLGALIQRLETARVRLHDYLTGTILRIDELEVDRLPFFKEPDYSDFNQWKRTVTVAYL